MQCVIFCGGLGTRLREETEFKPKPMVPIGGRPILWHIMKGYSAFGVKDFILLLGYRGDVIKNYFLNYDFYHNDFTIGLGKDKSIDVHGSKGGEDWNVTLLDTGIETEKGARLKKAEEYINEDNFFVTYGDGLSNIDIGKLANFHKSHGKIVTISAVSPASQFGEMKLEGEKVLSFSEKPEISNEYINGGFFVFDRKIFNYLSHDPNCDLERGALEEIVSDGEVMAHKHDGFWACMDHIRDVEKLNSLWHENHAPWRRW